MSVSRKKDCIYTREFLLSLKDVCTNHPDGLKEVVVTITQQVNGNRRRNTGNNQKNSNHNNSKRNNKRNVQKDIEKTNNNQKRDWDYLNDIRTVCNSKNSFTNRMKDLSDEQRFIGKIRGLLNKITDQTFEKIKTKLEGLEFDEEDEQFKEYINQISDIYVKKITNDSVYTELYAQSGVVLCEKFSGLSESIQNLMGEFFRESINEPVIEDIKKMKLVNLMKWLPFGCDMKIVDWDIMDKVIVEHLSSKIRELTSDEHTISSYASAITAEDVGVWIELACSILGVCAETKRNLEKYQTLLDLVKSLKDDRKKVKARIRFMIEDLVNLLEK